MSNISKWLQDRTWITWFLRDGKGHLKPVRDNSGRANRPDVHEEDRWKGYAGSPDWRPAIDESKSETIEMKIPRDLESSSPSQRKPADLKGTAGMGSPRAQPLSTAKRQVRFVAEDQTPKKAATWRYEGLHGGDDLRTLKYRVGNGGYFRRVSLPKLDGGNGHDEDRYPSRVLQALSDNVLDSDDVGSIIPENPFGTIREHEPFVSKTARSVADTFSRDTVSQYLPLLQFHTLLKKLFVSAREPFDRPPPNGFCICDIADNYGDWCGSVTIPWTWIKQHQNKRAEFIAKERG